uniref:Uncharacterized protein n=1 Tax=Anopheles melas TaxID=34690 RepID=A0A182TG04_9DIPT
MDYKHGFTDDDIINFVRLSTTSGAHFHSLITPSRLLDAINVCFAERHISRSLITSLCPWAGISGPTRWSSSDCRLPRSPDPPAPDPGPPGVAPALPPPGVFGLLPAVPPLCPPLVWFVLVLLLLLLLLLLICTLLLLLLLLLLVQCISEITFVPSIRRDLQINKNKRKEIE